MENNQLKIKNEKESSTDLKQKETFEELANRRIERIQDLSKQIDFNNLTYRYKGNTASKTFIGFKGPLGFYRNMQEGYITLEKSEKEQKEFKSEINEIVTGRNQSENQKSVINNIKTLYESQEKFI